MLRLKTDILELSTLQHGDDSPIYEVPSLKISTIRLRLCRIVARMLDVMVRPAVGSAVGIVVVLVVAVAAFGVHAVTRLRVSVAVAVATGRVAMGVAAFVQVGEFPVSVPDQISRPASGGLKIHDQVPGGLGHPRGGREHGRHRQVGQSPQHSRSSCRNGRLAVTTFVSFRATKPDIDSQARSPARMTFSARARVGSVRRELLDRILIMSARHLRKVLAEYETYFKTRRPHRSLDQASLSDRSPAPPMSTPI